MLLHNTSHRSCQEAPSRSNHRPSSPMPTLHTQGTFTNNPIKPHSAAIPSQPSSPGTPRFSPSLTSRTQRPPSPPPTPSRTVPTPKPYGYVPNSQIHRRLWAARTNLKIDHRQSTLWLIHNRLPHLPPQHKSAPWHKQPAAYPPSTPLITKKKKIEIGPAVA